MGRRFLVVGYEGRDHATAWKLAQSPKVEAVYVYDGNHAMAFDEKLRLLSGRSYEELTDFVLDNNIDCTIVGDTSFMQSGIVDLFLQRGLPVLGAPEASAALEGEKQFAKSFMRRHGIPTPRHRLCAAPSQIETLARSCPYPVALKSHQRVAGDKSVVIAGNAVQAAHACRKMFDTQTAWYPDKLAQVLLEEFIVGRDLSYIVLTDGTDWVPLVATRDYKRLRDGDIGPNTGGMGGYAPVPWLTAAMEEKIAARIVQPTLDGMRSEGLQYRGFLFFGIMIDGQDEPWALEYNTRLGDPEAQSILMLLEDDFSDLVMRAAIGSLAGATLNWRPGWALSVIVAPKDYPDNRIVSPVSLPFPQSEEVKCFGSIINRDESGRYVSGDGRLATVTVQAATIAQCRQLAYEVARSIDCDAQLHYRSDIGLEIDDTDPASPQRQSELSCQDLREDLRDFLERVADQRQRIAAFQEKLGGQAAHIPAAAIEVAAPMLVHLEASYDELAVALRMALETSGNPAELLRQCKHDSLHRWRSLQGITAAALASVNWQSPSFHHSRWSQAGTQTGRITGTRNDYLRDHHEYADAYEEAFAREYIDAPAGQPVTCYATVSGQAAFATAVSCLQHNRAAEGVVLAGAGCWFQNKMIIDRAFAGRIHYLDEHDTDGLLAAVRQYRPSVIFLDSLCNTETAALADLARLLPALAGMADAPLTVVIDNSCMATMCQPLRDMPAHAGNLRLIVTEGLNKFHQFGCDRVTAGILWTTSPELSESLFAARLHLGTNIPDSNVNAMPAPNRRRQDARMLRIGRNAGVLSKRLQDWLDTRRSSRFSHVVHAGLASHPAHAWASRLPFQGGSFSLIAHPDYQQPDFYKRFVETAVAQAVQADIDLIGGSGFGFDTTRVYLTALFSSGFTRPFIRISAGTESVDEVARLADVFIETIERM